MTITQGAKDLVEDLLLCCENISWESRTCREAGEEPCPVCRARTLIPLLAEVALVAEDECPEALAAIEGVEDFLAHGER